MLSDIRGGAAIIGVWLAGSAWAADPQTYKVRLEGAVSNEIENALSANSDLVSLRTSAPVGPMDLILRARGDTVRLKTVLKSYGYYQSAITVTIDGDALTDADVLAARTRLLTTLQNGGYAFAKVDPPLAQELPDAHQLDVTFHVVTGAVVN